MTYLWIGLCTLGVPKEGIPVSKASKFRVSISQVRFLVIAALPHAWSSPEIGQPIPVGPGALNLEGGQSPENLS